MLKALMVILFCAGLALVGHAMRRNPGQWVRIYSLGTLDGKGVTSTRLMRYCGWYYLILGTAAAVLLSLRLVYDLLVHGTEF